MRLIEKPLGEIGQAHIPRGRNRGGVQPRLRFRTRLLRRHE